MAKNKLTKRSPKKGKETNQKNPQDRKRLKVIIWQKAGDFIDKADNGVEKLEKMCIFARDCVLSFCAKLVYEYDKLADVTAWAVGKSFVEIARKAHDIRISLIKYRRAILKNSAIAVVAGLLGIVLFTSVQGYEYSYNGRPLGIVKEQKHVLEILELISGQLTIEYGSDISIDPETDISFRRVIAYGKEVDDVDTVLKRFTYMGDIQAQAAALVVDNRRIATVESKEIAESILQELLDNYMKNKDAQYEEISFAEDVKIEMINTTLAKVSSKTAAIKKMKSGGQKEVTYKVKSGDTLYGICNKLGVSFKELKKMNPGLSLDTVLHIGDKFVTQQEVPMLTVKTVEVSTFAEAVDFKTKTKKSNNYYEGETVVTQAGQKGKARVTARLTKHNGKTVDRVDLEKEIIKEPVPKIVVKGTKKRPPSKGTGVFARPVAVGVYRQFGMRWGRLHEGQDYAAPTGTTIRAADGGTVTKVGWAGAYGLRVVIDHGAGFKTIYAHCSRTYVSPGQKVFKGERIAAVGSTGRSTGAHCHFEIHKDGRAVNPAYYL